MVVAEDERAEEPNRATVVELATGEQTVLTAASDVPTTVGGTWALGVGLLRARHHRPGRDYCLATVDLLSGRSDLGPCVPPRHGLHQRHRHPGRRHGDDVRRQPTVVPNPQPGRRHRPRPIRRRRRVPRLGSGDDRDRRDLAASRERDAGSRRRSSSPTPGRARSRLGPGTTGTPDLVRRRGVLRPRPADATPTRPGCCGSAPTARPRWSTSRRAPAARSCPRRGAAAPTSLSPPTALAATSR